MKKLLALLLAALVLLCAPGFPARAEGEEEERLPRPHDVPQKEKSLEYWETVELPALELTGDLREDVLIIARSQVGYAADKTCYDEDASGRRRYYTRYGEWDSAVFGDWCDMFVSFCIHYAGNESYPKESSCIRHMFALKGAGYWREWNNYLPQAGDLVFFSFNSDNSIPNHVGLIEEVIPGEGTEPGKIVTIEGNMPNPQGGLSCVRRMVRSLNDVVGYGVFEAGRTYPEGYSIRSDGWAVIGEDSIYFVDYPSEEVLLFLGLYGSKYYDHWFPEEPEEEPVEAPPAAEPIQPAQDGPEAGADSKK